MKSSRPVRFFKCVYRDLKVDIKEAKKIHLTWPDKFGVMIITFLACFLFGSFGKLDLVLPVMNTLFVFGLVLFLKWRLRPHVWFWPLIVFFGVAHLLLLCIVVWPSRWVPASAWAGGTCIDLVVMLAAFSVVCRVSGTAAPLAEAPPHSPRQPR